MRSLLGVIFAEHGWWQHNPWRPAIAGLIMSVLFGGWLGFRDDD